MLSQWAGARGSASSLQTASVPPSSSVGKLQLKFQPMLSHRSASLLRQREGSQESLFLKQNLWGGKWEGGGREGWRKEVKTHGDGFCASDRAKKGTGNFSNTPEWLNIICNQEQG